MLLCLRTITVSPAFRGELCFHKEEDYGAELARSRGLGLLGVWGTAFANISISLSRFVYLKKYFEDIQKVCFFFFYFKETFL